jgi:hypothetical protein
LGGDKGAILLAPEVEGKQENLFSGIPETQTVNSW